MRYLWTVSADTLTTVKRTTEHPNTDVVIEIKSATPSPYTLVIQGHVETVLTRLEEMRLQVLELEQQMIIDAARETDCR